MLPFLTFASGIVAGIVGVKLLKNAKTPQSLHQLGDKARGGLDKAGSSLREATMSGLSVIEKSSADLRARLTQTPAETDADAAAEPVPAPKKKPAARKAAAKTAETAPAKPRRRAPAKKPEAEPEAVEPTPAAETQS